MQIMCTPKALSGFSLLAGVSVAVSAATGLFFLYKCSISDPGIIPTSSIRSDDDGDAEADLERSRMLSPRGHEYLDSPALWAGHWQQLCVTCRIVRPLRAKHCTTLNRCIEVYDHYCPWVGKLE